MRTPFDAEKWWADKPKKTWVVRLVAGPRKNEETHTVYVNARDREGAIRTAAANTYLKGKARLLGARLATPTDLGCTETVGAA